MLCGALCNHCMPVLMGLGGVIWHSIIHGEIFIQPPAFSDFANNHLHFKIFHSNRDRDWFLIVPLLIENLCSLCRWMIWIFVKEKKLYLKITKMSWRKPFLCYIYGRLELITLITLTPCSWAEMLATQGSLHGPLFSWIVLASMVHLVKCIV